MLQWFYSSHSDEGTSRVATSKTMESGKGEAYIVTQITCYSLNVQQTSLATKTGVKQNNVVSKVLVSIIYNQNKYICVWGSNNNCLNIWRIPYGVVLLPYWSKALGNFSHTM